MSLGSRSVVIAVLIAGTGACSTQSVITAVPGVMNDPANRTLRRDLLQFGTKDLCPEVQKRSLALRLRSDDPATGRVFIRQCFARELPGGDVLLQWSGIGYGWSSLTKRIGFEASATIDYDPDFRVADGSMYLYFRPNAEQQKQLNVRMAEQVNPAPFGSLIPVGSPQAFASQLGSSLFGHELDRGFTVIRENDGSFDFALGALVPGQRPLEPFSGGSHTVLANERIEIHQNQRDFAGPFEVPDDGDALWVTAVVEGAPTADLLVFQKAQGDAWLESYIGQQQVTPPPGPAAYDDTITAAVPYRRAIRVPRGTYYIVLDNTPSAGRTAPPTYANDDRAALVNLEVEVGSAQ